MSYEGINNANVEFLPLGYELFIITILSTVHAPS